MHEGGGLHSHVPNLAQDDPAVAANLANNIFKLSLLIEEQTNMLRQKEQRREAADKSRQPMPEVPATSSSAWNALFRSTMTNTIQPRADGWRSGLDAILVFLGLFSAIITAFTVHSLANLKQNESSKTNELLANLTNVIIVIGGVNAANLSLPQPTIFVPDSNDIRFNAYLSLSLIFSLSIAALAIACRGFLNLVSRSNHDKAAERLTDIRIRWKSAERILGPAIESLRQLLIVPVLLFILGLLDSLLSTALQLPFPPVSIVVTFSVSVLLVAAVALCMAFSLLDGIVHPTTSPFQSSLAHVLNSSLAQHVRPFIRRIRERATKALRVNNPVSTRMNPIPLLSSASISTYHEALQATRDDDTLDQASAALLQVLVQRTNQQTAGHRILFPRLPVDLQPEECDSLLHLLSPETSIRSHATAAQVIIDVPRRLRYSQKDLSRLIPSLYEAARRATAGTSLVIHWDSAFLHAMAIVANSGASVAGSPPVVAFLGCGHWKWKYLPPRQMGHIFAFIFEVLDAQIKQVLQLTAHDNPDGTPDVIDALLSPNIRRRIVDPQNDEPQSDEPQNVFAALLHLPDDLDSELLLAHIVSWLLRAHNPKLVISAADKHIMTIQHSNWLHLVGLQQYSMVPRVVLAIVELCLKTDGFQDHEMLARLCISCLLNTPNQRSSPPSGFVFHARPVLRKMVDTLQHVARVTPESSMYPELTKIRRLVEGDLQWKEGKSEVLKGLADRLANDKLVEEADSTNMHSHDISPVSPSLEHRTRPSTTGSDDSDYEAAEAGRRFPK
ncbi:hypothetical protein C8J57DRAFT_1331985 [Mycena rebaudengoi]|nr:hypothetical protein C8J57DRAFT_1331985 [Mycena rebaudengoi]